MKRLFETDEHSGTRPDEPKRLFESDAHFIVRTKTRYITEHDGRIAARCNEYPELVGRGKSRDEAARNLLDVIARHPG